jgi:hypothetical protein
MENIEFWIGLSVLAMIVITVARIAARNEKSDRERRKAWNEWRDIMQQKTNGWDKRIEN